ncbi:hypothetical protein HPP92_010889 [Vanilla planifolia]|uniref:VQ domain-containing protein n=1 Tax=Vanilla planifolia TaxID=51239 RepID=A0A835R7D8_VANPL|nr:hypothetical protein HPP92_011165 [Vanilla planifolia]KAG0482805.1 hypothetical protein HPP92_010889 [Vanilla planifolia]
MSMDSATSGSLQSSSGGNGGGEYDEFDSNPPTGDSISSFLNFQPPQPPPSTPQSSHLFNPFPCFFTPSFPSDLETDNWPPPHRPTPPPPPPSIGPNSLTASSSSSSPQPAVPSPPPPRPSKKRARASRRAPTTVLTTDTSNFRAMVQEFTGIPAPPFVTSPSFSRPRLDLLHTAPTFLRPFAHKLLQVPSTSPTAIQNTISIVGNSTNTSDAEPSSLPLQNPDLFNLQPLLHSPVNNPSSVSPWPNRTYSGGDLVSVIAGAPVDGSFSNSKRINCKQSEKQPVGKGEEGGADPWQLSSD